MKTKTTHVSNFGSYAPGCPTDCDGYITYHDSDRYSEATTDELQAWAESGNKLVRNAAAIELACREIAEWQSR